MIDPKTPSTLYVVAHGGVFKTTNGGANWSAVNTGLPVSTGAPGPFVNALAIDPNTPATVYAGLDSNGVFRSTDGGAHWSVFNNGMSSPISIEVLAVAPTHPTNAVYAGSNGEGVFVLQPGHKHHAKHDGDDEDDNE